MFKENGQPKPVLDILHEHGYNWVRLRLFVEPTVRPNTLAYTIASARMAKEKGFKILLDLHYSDNWADPGKQHTPDAWVKLSHAATLQPGLRVHARYDCRVSKRRCSARHGADWQRDYAWDVMARRAPAR